MQLLKGLVEEVTELMEDRDMDEAVEMDEEMDMKTLRKKSPKLYKEFVESDEEDIKEFLKNKGVKL